MITRTCDVCTKPLKEEKLRIELSSRKFFFKSFDFCKVCARELIKSMADKKLIKKSELEQFTDEKVGV